MYFTLLMLGSGLFWTITYLLIIQRSWRDRSYGMPLVALCANISWECIFSFLLPPQLIQHIVNLIWFVLDAVILALTICYGPREFPNLSKRAFYTLLGLALVTSFFAVLLLTLEFHDSGVYAAFGQNLMMSILFLTMLFRRRSLRGQSMSIALCKLLGTACASLAFYLYSAPWHHSVLLPFLYVATFIYDVAYVGMVYVQMRAETKIVHTSPIRGDQAETSIQSR
ncbi:hypothetical protein [Ktedonobacter racemifer]|uniref:Uncharacterized protein n=1 Tax=Ktedonobacter racemifer DSM 44963 TaxID=485913 RepID=D6TW98_KTERA|nr:hypothetical protein [Ktedonobacter racemifer]EFH84481.1 conserved hypothetical protein [Ktedonobacter racemifer DSM 44963]